MRKGCANCRATRREVVWRRNRRASFGAQSPGAPPSSKKCEGELEEAWIRTLATCYRDPGRRRGRFALHR